MSRVSVSIVIPALNEELNLPHVLPLIPHDVHEVILVDGQSVDRTVEVAQELVPGIRIVQQEGRGKGAALRSGFAAATGDIIVMLDADGSTDPREIPRFVHALLAGADFAKGSRFVHGGGTIDMPFHRRMGNLFFVHMVRRLHGGRYTDLCYGYNAFWRRHLPVLNLDGDGFEIETEMNIRALRSGLRVHEVPSFEDRRVMGIGNLRTFPDGWRVLRTIVRERRLASRHAKAAAKNAAPVEAPSPSTAVAVPIVASAAAVSVGGNGNGNGNGNGYGIPALAGSAIADTDADVEYVVRVMETRAPDGLGASFTNEYLSGLNVLLDGVDRGAIQRVVEELRAARERGSTVYIAGNGGSSATAAHWVNDLAKSTKQPGVPPMRVMNLTDNVPWLTALANDEGYDRVFSGQLETFARAGDVLIVISASGRSPNILSALELARQYGVVTIGLLGFDGGPALSQVDAAVWVRSEHGAYGLVETAHSAVADIVTASLIAETVAAAAAT